MAEDDLVRPDPPVALDSDEVAENNEHVLDEGMILDYITDQPIKSTPKEVVQQRIARAFPWIWYCCG